MSAERITAQVLSYLDGHQPSDDEVRDLLQAVAGAYGIKARFGDCCPQGHAYTAANTMRNKRGHRMCRKCHNAEVREWTRRKRQAAKAAEAGS